MLQDRLIARRRRRAAQARALWQRCLSDCNNPEACLDLYQKWMEEERAIVMAGGESMWLEDDEDG